ncbi:MAG: OmpA family protein, partial [Thermoanaerobaculia bacterium]|nr:OmpA family protein [Thermoanaerobaculia bacterium]
MGDDPVRDAPLGGGDGDGRAELERLRELILGPERADLDDLARRLDDDEVRAQELADVLPDAVRLGAAHDRADLTDALSEPVAEAMHRSVREDPGSLADALFPVMGPAIRRAIVETVRDMIESFNQAIEASLSWQGLRWRIEALRSGKSYAEVAILHSLVYRVEQLLLIHKETGLLLRQVVAPEVEAQDPDLVSGMLTAIRDFVKDSFGSADGDALDTFRVGELQVLIEDSPRAVLAAVVRGQPPRDLRSRLRATLEELVG